MLGSFIVDLVGQLGGRLLIAKEPRHIWVVVLG